MSRPLSSLSVLRYAKLTEGCFHSEGRRGSGVCTAKLYNEIYHIGLEGRSPIIIYVIRLSLSVVTDLCAHPTIFLSFRIYLSGPLPNVYYMNLSPNLPWPRTYFRGGISDRLRYRSCNMWTEISCWRGEREREVRWWGLLTGYTYKYMISFV